MSSPATPQPRRRSTQFVLLQDSTVPLAPKGHGVLTSLIRGRSTARVDQVESDEEAQITGGTSYGSIKPFSRYRDDDDEAESARARVAEDRRMTAILSAPEMRSMLLIGKANPRYQWERYWTTEKAMKAMKKPIREYYKRCNYLIQQYLYIDQLLDSSLPHDLLNEYNIIAPHSTASSNIAVPGTISEESISPSHEQPPSLTATSHPLGVDKNGSNGHLVSKKIKRTPQNIYRPTESTPLFNNTTTTTTATTTSSSPDEKEDTPWTHLSDADDDANSSARIVTVAIYINFAANLILLIGKLIVVFSVPSISVLASLVDAALDFLSTLIVWTTTRLIGHNDQYHYPIGRRRLEPLGVLVFSVMMITSFVQVALQAVQRLAGDDHSIVQLGVPALAIMAGTVVIKGLCWLWCRLVKNSSVQALAADAMTDVIFNAGSIAFPIVGFYAQIWWLDALGGLLLSLVVIGNWSGAASGHIKNLCGFSASADQRNILLYLTMRFAKTIQKIQGLQAYHAGDKLNVEVDIVLDPDTSLKDSHDLSESLQYVLESVPIVDRAFVHVDYLPYNIPTHMEQQAE